MAEAGLHSAQTELAQNATDSLLGPNPFIGLSRQEILDAWLQVLDRAIHQPASTVINSAGFIRELLRVLIGSSELQPEKGDKRFGSERFTSGRVYRRAMQTYLAAVKSLNSWLDDLDLDSLNTARARFLLSLLTDAAAPTNNLLLNPDALQKLLNTRGRSGLKGLRNLINDLRQNNFMPSQVDKSKFEVGVNVACTPGKVVFRNEVLELLQYDPQTPTVHAIPVLFAPPQINKYYVLDLSPEKSLMNYLAGQGFQTFAISWVNPGPEQSSFGMDAYVQAIREAINAVLTITGQDRLNMLAACAGGITTVIATAYFSAIGDTFINSLTLLVAALDMRIGDEDSNLGLFITPKTIEIARKKSAKDGVLKGSDTSRLFSWLRPNDLVWNYWVNNYLLGNDPPAFDVLFWNNDTTNLPAGLHSDFLDLYLHNPLGTPGLSEVAGMPLDLGMIAGDVYLLGGTTDHIIPWKATYRNTPLFGGDVTYVLSNSGHVQAMVNPPGNSRSSFMVHEAPPATPAEFLETAKQHSGSWWVHWAEWLGQRSGQRIKPPQQAGSAEFPPLEDAPGTYVYR